MVHRDPGRREAIRWNREVRESFLQESVTGEKIMRVQVYYYNCSNTRVPGPGRSRSSNYADGGGIMASARRVSPSPGPTTTMTSPSSSFSAAPGLAT